MIEQEIPVDTSKVIVREINKDIARVFIRKHHYSHSLNRTKYTLGVFYETASHDFFEGESEELIGCIVYAAPVGRFAVDSICGEGVLQDSEVLELVRLFVHDGYGRNIESYVIGRSFEWLRENDPTIKVLISYADPEYGHSGTIYRATNWLYQGCGATKLMVDYKIKLLENGKWFHSRTVGERFGNKNIENLAKLFRQTFWRKQETSKHRYIYFLCDKKEKKRLMKLLKLPIIPYIQTEQPAQLIQRIDVDSEGNVLGIHDLQGKWDGKWMIERNIEQ